MSQPPATPEAGRPAGPFTSIDSLTFSDDRRRISFTFTGARDPADGLECSAEYAAWTNVVGEVLEVGVFQVAYHTPAPPVECPAIGYGRSLQVDLGESFTGRDWHDLAGYRHFLVAPDGLVELDLPEGWQLVAERDVEQSRTGRWERTYARSRNAPADHSLVLYQAFDGPVNVTGGDDEESVEVHGRPATLYRWEPTGELVLVWTLDGDGLALVGHDPMFTVDQLVALAESAHVPVSTSPADGPPAPATPDTSPATSANGQVELGLHELVAELSGAGADVREIA